MYFNDLYSSVSARFANWLEVSTTGNDYIDDLALDYINRALSSLLMEAPRGWNYLTDDRYQLTISGNEADLPSDCGVILRVYDDSTGTGKPNIYYSNEGDISEGFRIERSFTKAAGFSADKIVFYSAPSGSVYLSYQKLIPAFTGTGDEYCAFPADILLLEAQRIRCREKGLINEWNALKADYDEMLKKFKAKHQNVAAAMNIEINDAYGNPLMLPGIGLNEGSGSPRNPYGFSNDTDYVRY